MSGDNVLVGVNWNQELVGRELHPYELHYSELTESDRH